jgi:hypothetical protein
LETIGPLNLIQELKKFNDNLILWLAESKDGQEFEVLTIKQNKDYQNLLDRLLKNEILPLINQEIDGIQEIVSTDFDTSTKTFYIVYQHKDGFEPIDTPTLKALKSILTGLDKLKRQNRFGYVISKETIMTNQSEAQLRFGGLFELFKHQNLLPTEFIAPEVIEGTRPTFQSDIYSVFKCFESILKENPDEILKDVFSKALSAKRTSRFSKYSEILEELEKVKVSTANSQRSVQPTIRVVVKKEDLEVFQPTLKEMNNSCYFLLDKKLSEGKAQITGQFSTKNYSGRFFVDPEGYIFIPVQGMKDRPFQKAIQQGFNAAYHFGYNHFNDLICVQYFNTAWKQVNTLAELNKTKHNLVKKWKTLPDQEREYIEEAAFKAVYTKREESKNNRTNIRFQLTDKFRNWDTFKELKRNDVNLFIDDKIVGKVQDYNPTDCFLVIKDTRITLDEIPEQGELHQDVRMETSQFKKQVEACKKFENKDIVNPELCGILATPERVPAPNRVDLDYDGFKEEVINPYLQTDDTQRDAVLEALHHKPVYLIQGPPGTGKTTVIVELIQQIIRQNSNAKILVTSQSNLAVDNVLDDKKALFPK